MKEQSSTIMYLTLTEIADGATPSANATVRRLTGMAREALDMVDKQEQAALQQAYSESLNVSPERQVDYSWDDEEIAADRKLRDARITAERGRQLRNARKSTWPKLVSQTELDHERDGGAELVTLLAVALAFVIVTGGALGYSYLVGAL